MAPIVSNARLFFENVRRQVDPYGFLSALPRPPRTDPFFEEEWIDFKGLPRSDSDLKRIWSKALSGFANITDGLVVWGIDARKTAPRDIDAACGLRLVPDPHAFESRLRDLIRDATNSPVLGVEYFSCPGPSLQGFVVCLVPESAHKPHRAEFADKHYYYRAGDDFLIAEPGLLRVLFYPRSHARLRISANLTFTTRQRGQKLDAQMKLDTVLVNDGTASAYDTYVVFTHTIQGIDPPRFDALENWICTSNHSNKIACLAKIPIHPGLPTGVCSGNWVVKCIQSPNAPLGILLEFKHYIINCFIYSKDTEMIHCRCTFVPEDLTEGPREKLFEPVTK